MRILIGTLVVLVMAVGTSLGCQCDPFSNMDGIVEDECDFVETELDVEDDVIPSEPETVGDNVKVESETEAPGMLNGALHKVTTDMFNLANHLGLTVTANLNKLTDAAGNKLTAAVTDVGIIFITMADAEENSMTLLLNPGGQIMGILSDQDELSRDLRKTLKEVLDILRFLGVVIPKPVTDASKGVPGSLTEAFNLIILPHS